MYIKGTPYVGRTVYSNVNDEHWGSHRLPTGAESLDGLSTKTTTTTRSPFPAVEAVD